MWEGRDRNPFSVRLRMKNGVVDFQQMRWPRNGQDRKMASEMRSRYTMETHATKSQGRMITWGRRPSWEM